MNSIVLLGRMTKDAEVRYTSTGKVVASFRWQSTDLTQVRTESVKQTLLIAKSGERVPKH